MGYAHITYYFFGLAILYIGLIGDMLREAIYVVGLLATFYIIPLFILEIDAWMVSLYRYFKQK